MDTLIYFGKVNLYWIMLYACYWLMLRNHTFFQWNRLYLLGSLCAAFTLPFVIYPETAPALPITYEVTAASFTFSQVQEVEKPLITWVQAIWIVYAIGFLISAYHLIGHIIQLRKYLKAGEIIDLDDCKVVLIDSNHVGSFSFLKWIVINRSDYEHHFDAILRHEMVHTQQWHSIDILLTEIMKVAFWFNPVLLLYKRSFQEVHEFLADEQAPNRETYARFLVAYALNAPVASLTNHFFKPSQIKSRIQMIYKNRTSKWLLSTYAVALTFIAFAAVLVAGCERKESDVPQAEQTGLRNEVLADKKIFTVVEQQPEFPGGIKAMYEFLGENLKYPEKAVKSNITGRVFLSFVVTEEGEIADVKVLKGIGYGCDEEAVRVLSKFPKWEPGKQNGSPVNVRYNLPINFQFDENDKSSAAKSAGLHLARLKSKPLIFLDGKVIEPSEAEKLNSNQIASVEVFKGEPALKAYGKQGENGVLALKTRDDISTADPGKTSLTFRNNEFSAQPAAMRSELRTGSVMEENPVTKVALRGSAQLGSSPLVFIDGVKQEKRGEAAFKDISPDNIRSISVLKNESAVSGYGEEGREGVVLIDTKK
jgi:TonB family protein